MIIKKLIVNRFGGHYFRRVKYLRPKGIFWCETGDSIHVFHDKKELDDFSHLCDAIECYKNAYLRDVKIEDILRK